LNCIYLDVSSQKKLFPKLSELLPYNHYCRKNLGYLYAIKKGYKIIYETDDDNRWNNETDDNNFNCSNDFNFITRNANEDNKKIQDCNQKNNSKNDNNNWDWDF
jgi:hypothetical protein